MVVENLVKTTVDEIQKVLAASLVIGEPKTIGDTTIIPLISTGFMFGAGGGGPEGQDTQQKPGAAGTGGGLAMKPVALVIIDKGGVRVEPVKGGLAAVLEKAVDKVPEIMSQMRDKKEKKEEK